MCICLSFYDACNQLEHRVSRFNVSIRVIYTEYIYIVTVSVGAGTVSDCWEITERGAAFSILFIGQFFGPLVGKRGEVVHASCFWFLIDMYECA